MRQRCKGVEPGAHVKRGTVLSQQCQIDRDAARMGRSAFRVGEKIRIRRMIPQRPLSLGRAKRIEDQKPESDIRGTVTRPGERLRRVGVEIAYRSRVNRRAGEIFMRRIGKPDIDFEFRPVYFFKHHGRKNCRLCSAKTLSQQRDDRMIALGIDTSGAACAAAVWRDGETLAAHRRDMARGHAEALMPMIGEALADAAISYDEIDIIGATTGPGSFTGVRTGLAASRGLSLALGCPLSGVTTFEAVAAAAARAVSPGRGGALWVVLETRRTDFFLQKFEMRDAAAIPVTEPVAEDAAAARALLEDGCLAAGDGLARLREQAALSENVQEATDCRTPDAALVAEMAVRKSGSVEGPVRPLYIHPPQAALPRNGGRLRP